MCKQFKIISLSFLKIFSEKPVFDAAPKIDAKNEKYVKPGGEVKVGKQNMTFFLFISIYYTVPSLRTFVLITLFLFHQIFDEKISIAAAPKVDAHNPQYVKPVREVKVEIYPSLFLLLTSSLLFDWCLFTLDSSDIR